MKSGSVWYELWPSNIEDALQEADREIPHDGEWHATAPAHGHLSHREMRFASNGMAQALSSDRLTPLFESLKKVEPPARLDDSDWVVSTNDEEDGRFYILTSGFAVTYGPYRWQSRFDEILAPYGLGIEPKRQYLRGEAYFPDLESSCFSDAVERLTWLETFFLKLNQSMEAHCMVYWDWFAKQVEGKVTEDDLVSTEIITPPSILEPMPPKTIKRLVPGERPDLPRIQI